MADLKKELDEYLLLNSEQKKSNVLNIPKFSKPDLRKLFNRDGDTTVKQSDPEISCCPTMTRVQRLISFVICLSIGLLCFSLSAMYIPMLVFKARKFALLFTLGSLFFIFSASFLYGPINHLKSLFSKPRILTTTFYFGSLSGTLYCALCLQSTPLTVVFAILQVITLLWSTIASVPGGTAGLKFLGSLFSRSGSSPLLPI
ncbi:vesicle transport protein SFT2C [Ctenocephalides felis]|uniref:vesicle transport protein SFT2C n=1 Tax=Ctenocephalides felis TaxID=7515 RepID=UPI000E6E42A3|nr:vesicle transport protein SFT2C [Ctenocephalides felis]